MTDDKTPDVNIVLPDLKYKDSYLSAVAEFQALDSHRPEDRGFDEIPTSMSDNDFLKTIVEPRLNAMKGIGLPQGWVPSTEFWIVDSDGFAGRVSVRHELSDYLRREGGHIGYAVRPSKRGRGYVKKAFRLVLQQAAQMGINPVLMTCDEDNEPSRRTILGALREFGGKEDIPYRPAGQVATLRYWINAQKCLERK